MRQVASLEFLEMGGPIARSLSGKHREQTFEPVLAIGLVLRASPLRINIPGGRFGA